MLAPSRRTASVNVSTTAYSGVVNSVSEIMLCESTSYSSM
jgi:hypothetical protein